MLLQQTKKWALVDGSNWMEEFFGSANSGTNMTYSPSFIFRNASSDILHPGKPWHNFVSFFWSTGSALPDLVLLTSNLDQTIQGLKPTSTMASPTLKFFQILSNWSLFSKSDVTYSSTSTTSQVNGTQTLTILAEAEFRISVQNHES